MWPDEKNQLVTDHFHCITILAGQPAQKPTSVSAYWVTRSILMDSMLPPVSVGAFWQSAPQQLPAWCLKTTAGFSPQSTVNRGGHPRIATTDAGELTSISSIENVPRTAVSRPDNPFSASACHPCPIPLIQPATIGVIQLHLNGIDSFLMLSLQVTRVT